MTPLVTVICPTFNRSAGILPSIESVRAQTVRDWQLIVVSDGCTDDTDDIVRSVPDQRVRLLRVANHGAPGGPRNAALAAATTPYVAYLDHDDRWRPDHLEVLLSMLRDGAELASTGCVRVDSFDRERSRSDAQDVVWHPELQVLNAMYEPSRVGHVRSLAVEAGGWSTELAGFEDWDLWVRLAERGVDFATARARTAVLVLDERSRRHAFRPQHGIGLATTGSEERAHRVRELLGEPDVHGRAVEAYLADTRAWYESLWNSTRCVRPPGQVDLDDVMGSVRAKIAAGSAGSFLRGIEVVPRSGRFVLALPTAVLNHEHRTRMRAILTARAPAQLALLRELLGR